MARLQYVTVREADFGAGIDQQSAENQIREGYVERLLNSDPQSTGHVSKRLGYQGFAGYVPVRIQSVEYAGTDITFVLDDSIELPTNQSSPIIVQGKTSVASGDFASETVQYYSSYVADVRKTFTTGTSLVTVEQAEHDITSEYMFVGVAESTAETSNDHTRFLPESTSIDISTKDVDITVDNNTGSDISSFVYFLDKAASAGTVYVSATNAIAATGSTTVTVLGATHALNNNNLIVRAFENTGTELIEVIPESVIIDQTSGDVDITLINNSGSGYNADIILSSAPDTNFSTGAVASGATASVTIDTSVAGATDFAFLACYLEPSPGADLEQVYPDSIVSDSANQQITVTFTNNTAAGANFEVFWEFASIINNRLTVTGTVSATFDDNEPQLTLWGLCHEEIYGTRIAREGWVNHIDSYRAPGENRMVCGLGGNLFDARERSEGTVATDYLLPLLYPRLNARLSADTIIGPAFYDTGETPGRTRGFITGDDGGSNFFEISDINYNVGTGYVEYTLTVPNMVISGTLSTIISSTAGLRDVFTAQQCGYATHNGEFPVMAVSSPTATTIVISVSNSTVTTSDFDETDVGGLGGIFTDQLAFSASSPYLTGDIVKSSLFSSSAEITAVSTSGSTTVVENVTSPVSLPSSLRLIGQRTSAVIPMRAFSGASSVTNLVRGDMLTYTGVERELRVKSINAAADRAITITSDGTTATATLSSGNTTSMLAGQKLLLLGSTSYDGVVAVENIESSTQFTFLSSNTTSESATIIGQTVEVDEEFLFEDTVASSNSFTVARRWIPVEIPTDNFDQTPSTRTTHFDTLGYSSQALLRSTTVQDNLYLTNGNDEILKYDGTNLYRAGLFRWQPHLFVTTDTGAVGRIVLDNPELTLGADAARALGQFIVPAGEETAFQVGDRIQDSGDGEIYTVTAIDSTNSKISVDRRINSAPGGASGNTLTRVSTFNYYFRLNAVDANNNILASAATGSQDFAVELGADAAVNLRLMGMPAWDIYDYDRLEVQVYRTRANSVSPFYLLATIAMSFDNNDGYVDYTDTDSDDTLVNLDEVNTGLLGAELGTAWREPLRAEHITSAGNRLILGNIKDYPELDIQLIKTSSAITRATLVDVDNRRWLFRKSSVDTSTSTDMTNRAAYEFVQSDSPLAGTTGAGYYSISSLSDQGSNVLRITTGIDNGLAAGNWVYLYNDDVTDGDDVTAAGWYQVSNIASATEFDISVEDSVTAASSSVSRVLVATTRTDVPVAIGDDGNYSMANGNRDLGISTGTSTIGYEFLAMRRMADAINASMRKTNTSLSGFESFEPWMVANAGNEFNTGQLIIRQPKVLNTTMELVLPVLSGAFSVFVNNTRRAGSAEISASTRLFPSRLLVSYPNFPEIFDNPTSTLDTDSDSAIDINSADGQEITAIIPFFGDAAFGAAQKSSIVVVFKTNSIYLVDLAAKEQGQNAVQKLETRGKGCTAPYSVSVTKGGIMFANESGIYRLNRNLGVDYIGRKYERIWQEETEQDQIALFAGHHDSQANTYKLSYVSVAGTENSQVAVYNHTREYEGRGDGSWTTYDNHPATGWANLRTDSFFASTFGRVFKIRRTGLVSDYRDDDAGINMEMVTRLMDQLESGRRKVYGKVITHFRTAKGSSTGTTLTAALDSRTVFQATDGFDVDKLLESTGIGDTGSRSIRSISAVFDEKVGIYLQLKYTNSTIDEPLEITLIDLRVAVKASEGITEAAETR